MFDKNGKSKLAIKLAKISVVIAFVLGLLLSSIQVYLDFKKEGAALDKMIGKILSVAQPPASTSVHLLSKDLAFEVVSGLLEYDFIVQASITDDLELVLADKNTHEQEDKRFSKLTELISEQYKAYEVALRAPSIPEETPGKLRVVVDINVVLSSFYDRSIIVFVSGVIRNFILTLLLILVFYYLVTRPLKVLSDQFSKRKPSSPGEPITVSQAGETYEFTALLNSINQFLSGSHDHIKELENNNKALDATREILETSENRYRSLYQGTDVSIWEEDFSELLEELNNLRKQGIVDIEPYLVSHPEHLERMVSLVKVIGVNKATLKLFAASNEEEFFKNIGEAFDSKSSMNIFAEEVSAIWNKESLFRREVKQVSLNGDEISVILSMPIPHSIEAAKRVPVTLLDLTQLKLAQDQLRKLSLAIQHNPSAVVIMNENGLIEYVNPKVSLITGYNAEELVGTNISNLRLSDEQQYPEDVIWNKLNMGEDWRCEVSARRKDGEVYWAREFIAPIKDLTGAITHYVAIYEDISEEKRVFEEISYRATHDKLTQLYNRDEFENRLDIVLKSMKHSDGSHALCFIDLDQFKVVNDTSGHIAGDQLLRQLAEILTLQTRKNDTLARIGGDEFAMLLENCGPDQAKIRMEKVRQVIKSFQFEWQFQVYRISASIGIAVINNDMQSATEIMKQADLACYVAKDRGRNQIHYYDRNNQQISTHEEEMRLVSEISLALKENRFSLYAQPIIPLDAADESVCYEVLIRMNDNFGNVIPPGYFLSSAEKYGKSSELDCWVIEKTFNWAKQHAKQLDNVRHFAINLSGRSIGDKSVLNTIERQLSECGLPARLFSFEITETAAIDNLQDAKNFIAAIKMYGCTVALDDFGSGLSSFAYLKNLSIDYLKIDGMFVKEIIEDPIDEAMVSAINTVGHVMGIKTIGEFVESAQIQSKLKKIGVDYVQGYGVSKPLPIDRILDWKKQEMVT